MDHRAGADFTRPQVDHRPERGASPASASTIDNVPDDVSDPGALPALTVGAPHTISSIDTIGDQDFFKVTLDAGQAYDIGLYGYAGGPNAQALAAPHLELYDGAGHRLDVTESGADTASGSDALLTLRVDRTGTYYVNAGGSDQGLGGNGVGDYEVFVATTDPAGYRPYYSVDSPLYAIDWGTQVDGSTRNPDGNQGPRDNGEPFQDPNSGVPGKNVITYYMAQAGDDFVSNINPGLPPETITATGWEAWDAADLQTALQAFAQASDVTYVEVADRNLADFKFVTYVGTPTSGIRALARMSAPGEPEAGLATFNAADERWTQRDLEQGGLSFSTLLRELGHGHGLAGPEGNDGQSGVMRGVAPDGSGYTTGDFELNQGVNTMMSSEEGWRSSPFGPAAPDAGYGWLGGPMAFDIAALQDKYGVNEAWASGDDTYLLEDVNAAGTFYECIWDAGGVDTIQYDGVRATRIDLRAATLEYEPGGGGRMSYASGIYGGYTIANGVAIEGARGGFGRDNVTGNAGANRMEGRDGADNLKGLTGADSLDGGAGADKLYGGSHDDELMGGAGNDLMFGGQGADTFRYDSIDAVKEVDHIRDLKNVDTIDLGAIDADATVGGDQAFTLVTAFTHHAGEAVLAYRAGKDATYLDLDDDGDGRADLTIVLKGDHSDFTALVL
jgi:Ca2+-binding RTX toxin-like protein